MVTNNKMNRMRSVHRAVALLCFENERNEALRLQICNSRIEGSN